MASIQDLSSKMFIFPQETNTAHVKLTPKQDSFKALTVCHRTFTDLQRNYAVFSLAVPNKDNGFLTFVMPDKKTIAPYIHGIQVNYGSMDCEPNKWYSLCSTWDSATGMVQLWVNGQPLAMKYATETPLTGKPIITLGQDQDSYGGKFDATQSFTGMMTDVHMWDYVLSPCEIQKFMKDQRFTPGNVLNWGALECDVQGRVIVGEKQTVCSCC